MRLSWPEIRARAAAFAAEWADAHYEKGETQSFYNEFFEVFGVRRRKVASFEEPVKQLGGKRGFLDLFWKGVLLVEQKSAGVDLAKAKRQALDYFPALRDVELPRYLLLSDFQTFELYDLDEGEHVAFTLADLPHNVERFGFILGVQKRTFKDQDPVNVEASELMGTLHDALKAAGYAGQPLERFLVRLVFCLFADDTGIFEPRDLFADLLEQRTREDGADTGRTLAELFQVLDTPEDRRAKNLDPDLARFPYVNGDLFRDPLPIPAFDGAMRKRLLDACAFDWSGISPAIFGALFQSVMSAAARRAQGAHYTTEQNILKVIGPLFLDELRAEFEQIRVRKSGRRAALRAFQEKLRTLTFLDPACGCGNFLVITYRELRLLEMDVMRELRRLDRDAGRQLVIGAEELSVVNVDQFYGIELDEFAARIAETALWMMDHVMNSRLSLEFGRSYVRIPLRQSPHIRRGDALETEWKTVLPPGQCFCVLGNPPFLGAKYQTEAQRSQVRRVANLGKSGGTLDYVTAWFITAGRYVQAGGVQGRTRIGFVATNSIVQGEQVAQLWPILFETCGLEIAFAHRTFAWGSDARGVAHVHVVIVGLTRAADAPKVRRLFAYDTLTGSPHESTHTALTPYLVDGSTLANPHVVVREAARPLNGFPVLLSGSQPIDDGHYVFDAAERVALLAAEPGARKFLRPYVGSREHINGLKRWILALQDASPAELKALPLVAARMRAVRKFREDSARKQTLEIAAYPTRYNVEVLPTAPFLVIPEVSSERRMYVPIGWVQPPTIPSNLVRVLVGATKPQFALLTSAMHMSWLRYIGGRLKSDYRYSIGLVYNTFPTPSAGAAALARLEPLADAVLTARAAHAGATLADLYDPDLMPGNLRKAHQVLDRAVDRLYRPTGFTADRERAEYLLALYERAAAPLLSTAQRPRRSRAASRPSTA